MTTDPVPLSTAQVAVIRECHRPVDSSRRTECECCGNVWPCDAAQLVATLDEARATPSGDLWLLLHEISGDLDARTDNGDDIARDLGDRLRAALRSVSADSTAGLDMNRMGRALHRVLNHGYHGGGQDDGDGDLGAALIREYASLSSESR